MEVINIFTIRNSIMYTVIVQTSRYEITFVVDNVKDSNQAMDYVKDYYNSKLSHIHGTIEDIYTTVRVICTPDVTLNRVVLKAS